MIRMAEPVWKRPCILEIHSNAGAFHVLAILILQVTFYRTYFFPV